MSRWLAVLLVGFSQASAAGPPERFAKAVHLNAPDALERLAAENPAHYGKIRALLAGIGAQPPWCVAQWIRTSFDATSVQYGGFWRMSYPPKTDIAFTLGDTRYYGRLTLGGRAVFVPVDSR